jgi:hypothetical protein
VADGIQDGGQNANVCGDSGNSAEGYLFFVKPLIETGFKKS